jgi:hypothetical protein
VLEQPADMRQAIKQSDEVGACWLSNGVGIVHGQIVPTSSEPGAAQLNRESRTLAGAKRIAPARWPLSIVAKRTAEFLSAKTPPVWPSSSRAIQWPSHRARRRSGEGRFRQEE